MGEPTEIIPSTSTNLETAVAIRDDILRADALATEVNLWLSHLDALLGSLPMLVPGVPVDLTVQAAWLTEAGYLGSLDSEGLVNERIGIRGHEFFIAMLTGQNVGELDDILAPTTNAEIIAAARTAAEYDVREAELAFINQNKDVLFEVYVNLYLRLGNAASNIPVGSISNNLLTAYDDLLAYQDQYGYFANPFDDPMGYLSENAQAALSDTSVAELQTAIRTILSQGGLELSALQQVLPEELWPLARSATWDTAIAIDADLSASIAFFTKLLNDYDPMALKLRLDMLRGHIINLPDEIIGVSIAFIKDALLAFEVRTRERVNALKRAADTLLRIQQFTRPYSIQLTETREETLRNVVFDEIQEEMRTWPWLRNIIKDEWESLSNDELWDVANWALLNNPHNLEPLNRGFLQDPEFEGYLIPNNAAWDRHIGLLTALEDARPTPATTNSWAIVIELAFSIISEVFDYILSFGDVVNSLKQKDWGAAASTIFFAAFPILPGSFSRKISDFPDLISSHTQTYRRIVENADIDEATRAQHLAKIEEIDRKIDELREPISELAAQIDELRHIDAPRTRGEYLERAAELRRQYNLGPEEKNIGIADYILDNGERGTIESISGRERFSQSPFAPFVPDTEMKHLFENLRKAGSGAGAADTEAKILYDFAIHHQDTSVSGKIFIFTDRWPCPSCNDIIYKDFKLHFPNIEVIPVVGKI
jgi:hypothetical protein